MVKHTEEQYRELGHNVALTYIRTIPRDQLFNMSLIELEDKVKQHCRNDRTLREFLKQDRIPKLAAAYFDGMDTAIQEAF